MPTETPSTERDTTPVPGGLVRLDRPSRGNVIHRTECRHAQRPNALRWFWGEQHDNWLDAPWLKWCRTCYPEDIAGRGPSAGSGQS